MTDLGNGTYTGDFTVEQSGEISILIVLLNENGVHADFFNNNRWENPIAYHEISPNVNYDWGTGKITPERIDYVTAYFYTYIKAPTTETYTFDLLFDDGSDFYFDTNLVFQRIGTYAFNIVGEFSKNLVAGEFYDYNIVYKEWLIEAQ
jgi:hypothetical protein